MKTVEKTSRRILLELTLEEIKKFGFENLWDDIRVIYPTKLYDLYAIEESVKGMIVTIELRPVNKKFLSYSANT